MKKFAALALLIALSSAFAGSRHNGDGFSIAPRNTAAVTPLAQEPNIGELLARLQRGEMPDPASAAVTVDVLSLSGSLITSIPRGNTINIVTAHPSTTVTGQATAILLLPVNDPTRYRETLIYSRRVVPGVAGESFPFYIPAFSQIEGTAFILVSVPGEGVGFALLTVTP